MLYTLDTNFATQLLNGNQTALNNLLQALNNGHDVVFNAISYYEINRGLALPTFQRKHHMFDGLVQKHGLLDLDTPALDAAIDIYQTLSAQGNLIEDADLLMAAIARANAATLVTNNTRHFQRVARLNLVDWQ